LLGALAQALIRLSKAGELKKGEIYATT
jgi:hypothetical protein